MRYKFDNINFGYIVKQMQNFELFNGYSDVYYNLDVHRVNIDANTRVLLNALSVIYKPIDMPNQHIKTEIRRYTRYHEVCREK